MSERVFVCVYIYICAWIPSCMCVCKRLPPFKLTGRNHHSYIHIPTYIYISKHTRTHTRIHLHTYTHTHAYKLHICIRTLIYTHIHSYTLIHIHTHMYTQLYQKHVETLLAEDSSMQNTLHVRVVSGTSILPVDCITMGTMIPLVCCE